MNHLRIYCNLIRKAENRTPPEGYIEKHHIFPVSIFGKNKRVVVLTAREHYIAHLLLEKIYIKRYGIDDDRTRKMTLACVMMRNRSEKYNSHLYEQVRKRYSDNMKERMKGENNPQYGKRGKNCHNYGKSHSEEIRKKLSERQKGEKNHNYGKSFSEETRRKMSEAQKGEKNGMYGKSRSEESRKKQSEALKGKYGGEKHYLYGKSPSEETKRKLSEVNKNKKWWNNGCGNTKFSEECPGENWVPGRGKKKLCVT